MERVLDFVRKNRGLLAFCPLMLALLSGCASREISWPAVYEDDLCQQLWLKTETIIQQQEVADNTTVRVRNFPYLRSNRYLQGLADQADGPEQRHYVLEQMRQLDLDKRLMELSRLSAPSLATLAGDDGESPASLTGRLQSCSRQFLQSDERRPGFFEQVQQGIDLDRDYSLWLRGFGLYPLTSLVVDVIAENAQDEMVARLHDPAPVQGEENRVVYRFSGPERLSPAARRQLFQEGRHNPLLSLELSPANLLALAQDFAPMIAVNSGDDGDRFGRITLGDHGFSVDGREQVVYYYFSQAFVQGISSLQINYVIWFPERGAPAPWFEQGRLDGLVFRITLDWQGEPIFTDVSFQCGCYHFVLFNGKLVSGTLPAAKGFQPFSGGELPDLQGDERLQFSINSGWHQIGRVAAALPLNTQPTYQLRPYQELEYFRKGNKVISLFNKEGRVPGTNRLERFFLFPMGIPKVGAMRQRGRQPITLIGRAYFDDPYLFDNAFGYRLPRPGLADLLKSATGGHRGDGSRLGSLEKRDGER